MPSTDTDNLAKQLWAIGDQARLRILLLLPETEDCEHGNNVSQLAIKLKLSQPTVSHHLRVLRQAGFIQYRKMCRDVYYWKNCTAISELACQLQSTLLPCNGDKKD